MLSKLLKNENEKTTNIIFNYKWKKIFIFIHEIVTINWLIIRMIYQEETFFSTKSILVALHISKNDCWTKKKCWKVFSISHGIFFVFQPMLKQLQYFTFQISVKYSAYVGKHDEIIRTS